MALHRRASHLISTICSTVLSFRRGEKVKGVMPCRISPYAVELLLNYLTEWFLTSVYFQETLCVKYSVGQCLDWFFWQCTDIQWVFFSFSYFCYSRFPCKNSWKLVLFHGFRGHRMLSFVMSSKTDASLTSCFSQMVLLVYVYKRLLCDICTKEQTTGWLPLAARWRKFSIFLLYRFILFFFLLFFHQKTHSLWTYLYLGLVTIYRIYNTTFLTLRLVSEQMFTKM